MASRTTRSSRAALASAMLGVPLWALSYVWVPFAISGRALGAWGSLIVVGELGAIAAGIASVVLGASAVRASPAGTPERSTARRSLLAGMALLALIVVPNLMGVFFFSTQVAWPAP